MTLSILTSHARGRGNATMTSAEVARLMAEYEEAHGVQEYWACGWRVWPHLRVRLSAGLCTLDAAPTAPVAQVERASVMSTATRLLAGHIDVTKRYYRARQYHHSWGAAPDQPGHDVLIVSSGRVQLVDGIWERHVSDPLAELLTQVGLKCLIWQIGEPRYALGRPASAISPLLRFATRLSKGIRGRQCSADEPRWFAEYAAFHERCLGTYPQWWDSVAESAQHIRSMSAIMERWIRRSGVRLIVLDCWYGWEMIAAGLAAHRLGIPVMDVQHGIQEHTHFGYHEWRVEPAGGWDAFPDFFWVWGERAEALYHRKNRISHEVLRGGNPWLQAWLGGSAPALETECKAAKRVIEGFSRSVLVTATHPISSHLAALKALIAGTPTDWCWLIRLHPGENAARHSIAQELANPRVLLNDGTDLPLYALLKAVDLHVSHESTCSFEALAFGKPTIIITEPGADLFREFIEQGLMFHARRPEDFADLAARALRVDRLPLLAIARGFFADNADTRRAVGRIAEIVRDPASNCARPRAAHINALGANH